MNMKFSGLFAVVLTAVASICAPSLLTSCISDAITTSPSDVLTFSRDTVSFDTVFTDVGTPTARLVVHNRASKGINISSISFKNENTCFRMNVDGVSGSDFHDVEIRAKDSIYMFVECLLPETEGNKPYLMEDAIEFVTNGVRQSVLLEAWGQNVTRLRGVVLDSDMRLTAERPYVVFDSLVVSPGRTLSIDPGVQLLFHDKAYMHVQGTLLAEGSADRKIDMRGDRIDNVLPDVSYDIMAGQWKGIRIAPGSFGNRLAYVDMRSTEHGLFLDSCNNTTQTKLTLYNSWLHNSQRHVLYAPYSRVEATGCCFSEAGGSVVALYGGAFSFLQCTFANNYLFAAIDGPLVGLWHTGPEDAEKTDLPYMKAEFDNCILYGLPSDLYDESLDGSQVFFRYCSFKSEGENDDNFQNCLWDTDPMFRTVREDYYFNYRLKADSPVLSAGDPALLTSAADTDMDGVSRVAGGNPSLGAYQYVPEPED